MRFEAFSFGSIRIDGATYEHDVVIDHGSVRNRKKKASKKFRDALGHTPLSVEEEIPWDCRRLVIGSSPHQTARPADSRAIEETKQHPDDTNAILHVTC